MPIERKSVAAAEEEAGELWLEQVTKFIKGKHKSQHVS